LGRFADGQPPPLHFPVLCRDAAKIYQTASLINVRRPLLGWAAIRRAAPGGAERRLEPIRVGQGCHVPGARHRPPLRLRETHVQQHDEPRTSTTRPHAGGLSVWHNSHVQPAAGPDTFWTLSLTDWLAIIGLIVGVAGFGITIWQLVRTARASEATKDAVERTEKHLAASYLLVLLPQFRIIESDLDNAAMDDDRRLAMRALRTYADVASEVRSLLASQADIDAQLLERLGETALAASQTKASIVDNPGKAAHRI